MSSDPESPTSLDNLKERRTIENRIPRSPAVDAYESYAAWRKKKFPPRPLDYKAEDYTLPKTQTSNENHSTQNPPNPAYQRSSYFPSETQNPSENYLNRNPPDSMLPRSSYFSVDSENFTATTKNDLRRSNSSNEDNHERYNPKMFQGNDKESQQIFQTSPHINKSSPVNKISQEANHYLKKYSARSDNSSTPSSSSPKFSTRTSNSYSPTSRNQGSSRNLRTNQKEFVPNNNHSRKSSVDYDPQLNPNVGALQPVRYKSDQRHSFPSYCPTEHKSREPENVEVVKGLMKLIENQNEQIKNLQAQLDRLLKIHEETLREKSKCACSFEIARQNPQICMQAYNAALHAKNPAIAAESFSNRGSSKNHDFNQVSNELPNRRNVQFEEHSKKTLMERKVSIGVMTSFEFTVQNSPFNLEAEDQPVIEEQEVEEIYEEEEENNPSNADLSRRKQNLFSLMPSPLENIIEDSESHLSSSQQPSSNYLSSCKSGNLQTQNGRNRTISGNNSNNTNNPNVPNAYQSNNGNNFNNSNSPSNFNKSNQNSPSAQNYSNNTNTQNRRENGGQTSEIRNQRDAGRDFPKQNTSPIIRTEPDIRETIPNSRRTGTPHGFENTKTPISSTDFRKTEQNRKERQGQEFAMKENIRNDDNFQEESLILSGGQLEVRDRIPPSPAPSIHVDMQEYSSEDGSVHTKRTPKVGWTFYNNVLGQVNNILQNSPIDEQDIRDKKGPERQELDKNVLMDTVKAATMDQLKKLGISFVDNNEMKEANANKKVTFDASYYSPLNPEMNMMQGTSTMTETNTSMHMKALAMKYLKEEQVCDAMQQKQRRGALKNLMLSNVQGTTNMSFATMRYLQRYQLLPESMNGYIEDEGKENFQMQHISDCQKPMTQKPRLNSPNRPALAQTTKTSCPSKILDISTLKQQPKLL